MIRILLALCAFAFISCDRHDWEGEDGTNRLFKPHGGHDSHAKEEKGH